MANTKKVELENNPRGAIYNWSEDELLALLRLWSSNPDDCSKIHNLCNSILSGNGVDVNNHNQDVNNHNQMEFLCRHCPVEYVYRGWFVWCPKQLFSTERAKARVATWVEGVERHLKFDLI